jgi:hypothetical protein
MPSVLRTVLSALPEAMNRPSGLKATVSPCRAKGPRGRGPRIATAPGQVPAVGAERHAQDPSRRIAQEVKEFPGLDVLGLQPHHPGDGRWSPG